MGNLDDFESLYNHIEENGMTYKYPHQIAELFKRLRDSKHKENKTDEAEKAQWEIEFFNFGLYNNKLSPKLTATDEKGKVIIFPNLDEFNDKTYAYLIERSSTARIPLTRARYSHLLWLSPKKHLKYAKVAIDSYLELANIYEKQDMEKPDKHYGLDLMNAIRNAFFIACQVKYRLADAKSEIIRLIWKFNDKSSSTFALRNNLIDLMLKEKKVFLKNDYLGIADVCWRLAEMDVDSGKLHGAIRLLELGEKVDARLNQKFKDWRKRIAELYEILMRQAEQGNSLAALSFCQQALENYKITKDEKKTGEIEKIYAELRGSMKLVEFKQKIDLSKHIERCREIAENLARKKPKEVIKTLMVSKHLLPKYKNMEKIAEDIGEKHPILKIFHKEVMDQRGHPAQHFTEDAEEKYYGLLQQYQMDLQINNIPLIREIFFSAIRNNKLNTEELLDYLAKRSWFGKILSRKLGEGREITYNWLSLLAPSINDYFVQIERWFLKPTSRPNMVLPIDSLTLKIEGLLRDMCEFSGIATFNQTKDRKGRRIVREKDLHALLYEDKIKQLFDEDDLLFFKFLLVEQAGLNLRHRIAHSLLYFQEYGVDLMHLLILALLRIGKYDFVKESKAES